MDKIYIVYHLVAGYAINIGYCATLDLAHELVKRYSTYGEFEDIEWEWDDRIAVTNIRGDIFKIIITPLINSSEKISEIL